MDELSPVLAYLKSWGQYDAYDRVVAARDRIDSLTRERDELAATVERLREALSYARKVVWFGKPAIGVRRDCLRVINTALADTDEVES